MKQGRDLERFGKRYATLAVMLLNAVVLLALLEFATRLFFERITPIDINAATMVTDAGQEPYFQYNPFASFAWIPHARFGVQTVNSQGFVSTREIPFERQDNELRVVTLGGSSTVGNGNPDGATYPRLLEQMLQKHYPDKTVNVINAAAGGYSTIESLGYLQTRMIHYRPDIIIIMHAWNDMYYFTYDEERISRWRENFNLQVMWDPGVSTQLEDPLPADVQYLSWSQLYLHIRDWVRRSAYGESGRPQMTVEKRYEHVVMSNDSDIFVKKKPVNPKAYGVYETNLRQIHALCEQRKIRCVSILQPSLITKNADRAHPAIQIAEKDALVFHGFDFDSHLKAFDRMYAINETVFGSDAIVDAREISGDPSSFLDRIHLNVRGNLRLADLVYRHLTGATAESEDGSSNN